MNNNNSNNMTRVELTNANTKAINFDPDKNEMQFYIERGTQFKARDGRLFTVNRDDVIVRKYFKPEDMRKVLDAVEVFHSKTENKQAEFNRLLDIVNHLEVAPREQ